MKWHLLFVLLLVVVVVVSFGSRLSEGFDTNASDSGRCRYLEDMVKYLKLVVQMQQEREKVYPLTSGFGSPPVTFTSPRLTALEKQRQYFIEMVKKDSQELAFFRKNLTL